MEEPLPPIEIIPIVSAKPHTTHLRFPTGRQSRTQKKQATPDLRWLKVREFLSSRNLSPASRKTYEPELKRFLEWTDMGWHELQPRHIAQFKQHLGTLTGRGGKPFSKASINKAISALKSFYVWMYKTYPEVMHSNPAASVQLEKLPVPLAQSLTHEQMEQVWGAIEYLGETKERDRVLVHLLSHGLRADEVVNLNVGAFDGKLVFLADTKNDEPRLVPLDQEARAALTAYLESREADGEFLEPDCPLLLSHHSKYQGQRLTYRGVYFAVEKLGRLAGIEDLHPHQFRHTYATGLLEKGMDPAHAMLLTGHKDLKTFKRYTLRSRQEAAIAAFYKANGEANHAEEPES